MHSDIPAAPHFRHQLKMQILRSINKELQGFVRKERIASVKTHGRAKRERGGGEQDRVGAESSKVEWNHGREK